MTYLQHEPKQSRRENIAEVAQTVPAWVPANGSDAMIGSSQPLSRIRTILPHRSNGADPVARLLSTRLGRFYTSRLKQYSTARFIIDWIWRRLYPIYASRFTVFLSKRIEIRWRSLAELSGFAKKRGLPIHKLVDRITVNTPVPKVFPTRDQDYLGLSDGQYEFPDVFVATLRKAMVYGGTNLVLADGEVVCHDLYDFERDYTSEELHGRHLIHPGKKRIRWLLHDPSPEYIPEAASFVDACAPNYAHWLTEVLPRIALFCGEREFEDVPIIINHGLHKNIMESLFLVTGEDREIITLPIGRALRVDKLHVTSAAGYVPFERRNNRLSGHSHGRFSPDAFQLIRRKINPHIAKLPKQVWPERIYIRRRSEVRTVTNSNELEAFLLAKGYVIVEPERLSFLHQTELFSHAKAIVGSSGAALANMVFARSGVRVFILMGKYPNTSYGYWQNIACANGFQIAYGLCRLAGRWGSGIHSDFYFNLKDFPEMGT